jgi:hypothetical protein
MTAMTITIVTKGMAVATELGESVAVAAAASLAAEVAAWQERGVGVVGGAAVA